jgi:CelD/BcsL family acetyltransferase involved in cellulose biosynthesis
MVIRPLDPFREPLEARPQDPWTTNVPPTAHGVFIPSLRIASRLPTLSVHSPWIRYVPRQYDRHYADLTTSYAEYVESFSSKSRSGLRRKARKFEERSGGSIEWKRYRTPAEIAEFYRMARDISRESYQERLLDAGLPADDDFLTATLEQAKNDRVRGYLIFLDGRAVAYLFCPIQDGIVTYAYLGFRQEFADLSPGTVLLWMVMEDLFREGSHRIFDFTEGGDRGQHSQKRLFATGSIQCADVYLLRPTIANLLIAFTHASVARASTALGLVLKRIGLKRTVKWWIRRRGVAR